MQQGQHALKQPHRGIVGRAVARFTVGWLGQLQVPRTEVVPDVLVGGHEGLAQAELGKALLDVDEHLLGPGFEPADAGGRMIGLGGGVADFPSFHQAEGVPNLVGEVAPLLAQALVKRQVVAGWRGQQHADANAVRPVLLHELDGVGAVAERLGHFPTLLVPDDARVVDVAERRGLPVFVSGDDHPGDPEEHDFRGGHEVVGGVVVIDFLLGVEAVKHADRPEPRAEPRVEDVLVLAQVGWGDGAAGGLCGHRCRGVGIGGDHIFGFC